MLLGRFTKETEELLELQHYVLSWCSCFMSCAVWTLRMPTVRVAVHKNGRYDWYQSDISKQ